MNLRSIDLNLLVIFDALMAEQSISRAAKTIGMTPSAVSHALQRLRQTFNDPLIERTPRGMVPTRRAQELIAPVRAALHGLQHGIAQQLQFDPATSRRTFNICQSDFMSDCLLPRLCARVRTEAPGVALCVANLPGDDDANAYEPGDIQIRIGARVRASEFRRKRMWNDPFVLAMRKGHPAAAAKPTLERFLALPYLDVASVIIDRRTLDEVLTGKGLARRAVVTVPSLAGVVSILEHTDLCAILPGRWVRLYSSPHRLVTQPLPIDNIDFAIDLVWHARDDKDPGHRWLRRLVSEEFAALDAPAIARGKREVHYSPNGLDVLPPLVAK